MPNKIDLFQDRSFSWDIVKNGKEEEKKKSLWRPPRALSGY